MSDQMDRIPEIESRLAELPKGNVSYKQIKGKSQPYLQWTEDGKHHSVYLKTNEREQILLEIEERKALEQELRLLKTYSKELSAILMRQPCMSKKLQIGQQSFVEIMESNSLYIDKSDFLDLFWHDSKQCIMILRPRRFGKTLMLNMTEAFFSNRYAGRKDLFEKLKVWKNEDMRAEQGQYPVINLSFSGIKQNKADLVIDAIENQILKVFHQYSEAIQADENPLTKEEKQQFKDTFYALLAHDGKTAAIALNVLSELLMKLYGKPVLIFMDEFDSPIQETYLNGEWDKLYPFYRTFTAETFKDNPYLKKALLFGITNISTKSVYSGFNNLAIYDIFSTRYAESFGFLESEVDDILDFHDEEEKQKVKDFYDGFTFGNIRDIYNPWSVLCYLDERHLLPYWINTGSNQMVSRIIAKGPDNLRPDFEKLLNGESIHKTLKSELTLDLLESDSNAVWNFLLTAGYLKADHVQFEGEISCDLSITNQETELMFQDLFACWFTSGKLNDFCDALIFYDEDAVEYSLNAILKETVSYYDVDSDEPERFYHGLVLGLIVCLRDQYRISSNRESGLGRYDICMFPKKKSRPGIILEFKVKTKRDASLEDACRKALQQIHSKKYKQELVSAGVKKDFIYGYGIAFEGKEVMVLSD